MRSVLPSRLLSAFAAVALLMAGGVAPRAAADAPAVDQQVVDKAVQRAVAFLKARMPQTGDGRSTLTALAMLKAEVPADTPEIARVLEGITQKVTKGVYAPKNRHEHGYESGLDAILLEAADREKYKPEIEAIAKYLLRVHNTEGHWNYPDQLTGGDTSITQYGILGLWAASRAGVHVPAQTWDKACGWHLKAQNAESGGWGYHPFDSSPAPSIGMTAAATASLHVCRMHLYPRAGIHSYKPEQKKRPAKRFGLLERYDPEKLPGEKGPVEPAERNYNPTSSLERIDKAIEGGLNYMQAHFTIDKAGSFQYYYLYTLERLTALADLQFIGEHDWYAEGVDYLLKGQKEDGSLGAQDTIDTSFGVMFLVRATNKMMNRQPQKRTVGGGLLAGGRGLPDDLKGLEVKGGKVETRKPTGPLDELLSELENTKSAPVGAIQKAIVESVQLGNREKLLEEADRLKRLAKDPRAEVRRTAFWALGRGRDIRVVPLLIGGLEDRDVDAVVEAHNALCFIARKPEGLGAPLNPLEGLDEEATAEQRTAALTKWQASAVKLWKAWYLTVRPYEERHDLLEPRAPAK